MIEEGDYLNSLEENRTDIYYQAIPIFEYDSQKDNKIEITKTAHSLEYGIGQILNEPNNLKKTDLSSFLIENWNLVSYMLIGYLLLFFFSYIFAKKLFPFLSLLKKSKLISSKLLYDDYTQLRAFSSKIALIFLFFNLFLFILINLLANFIKTEAVIVNTDELIDSNKKLLTTSKILLTWNWELYHLSTFSKNSLLFKLVARKKKDYQYVTPESNRTKIRKMVKKGESSSFFIFQSKPTVLMNLIIFAMHTKNPIIFVKPTSYQEKIYVYYMRKKLEKNKKRFINQW